MEKPVDFWVDMKKNIEEQFEEQDYAVIKKETPYFLLPPENFIEKSKKAGTGKGSSYREDSVRNDHILWVDEQSDLTIQDFLKQGVAALSEIIRFPLVDCESHWAFYPKGTGFYGRHIDAFKVNNKRVISMVTYFNDQWDVEDGGVLRLYNNDNQGYKDIIPKKNTWVFFSSEKVEHEVLKTLKPRYSMAAWFKKA